MTTNRILESIRANVDALKTEIRDLEHCYGTNDYRADYVSDMLRRKYASRLTRVANRRPSARNERKD